MLKLSVSSIGTYEKCPKQYHYRYIEKPDVERVKWPATEFGSCAHLALEIFHKTIIKKNLSMDALPSLMKWCMKKALSEFDMELLRAPMWSPDGDKPGLVFLKEILQTYLDDIREGGIPNVVGVEVPYNFNYQGVLVRGYIDRVDKIGDETYRVVDYKTSKSPKYLNDFQLLVYAEAIKRIYDDCKIVHGSYMLLKHDCRLISYEFSDLDHKRALKKIAKNSSLIQSDKRWVKIPSVLCNWCDYQEICQNNWTE
tara:strand:+ start:773 stop:1534 length:762 start_codon:yes stop_codon:yes gene_type:complete